jgi:hypothetical protein
VEFPVFWTVLLLVQALLGDGAYAWCPIYPQGRVAIEASRPTRRTSNPARLNMKSQAPLPPIEPRLTPRPVDQATRIGHVHLKVFRSRTVARFLLWRPRLRRKQRYGDRLPSSRRVGITITSVSIPGRAEAARHRRRAPPGSSTSPFVPDTRGSGRCLATATGGKVALDGASDHGGSEAL